MVKPPVGRFHESLWEIAQKYLGDGRRYREIFELNSGRIQPDGSRLTIASLIRPGWVLNMPRDAHGPGLEVATAGDSRTTPSSPAPAPAARPGWPRPGWGGPGRVLRQRPVARERGTRPRRGTADSRRGTAV